MFGKPFAAHPQSVRNPFRGCTWVYCGVFCNPFRGIRHAFAIRSEYIHGMFATCSFSVCYIFALQKYGFCFLNVALLQFVRHAFVECLQRVRFLYVTYSHYKSMVFDVQKYGF